MQNVNVIVLTKLATSVWKHSFLIYTVLVLKSYCIYELSFVPCVFYYFAHKMDLLMSFWSCLCRSDADYNRWVSPHSERRSLQPHNDALPEAEAQEQKAEEGAEADHAPPSDPGPDCLTRGRGSHEIGESWGAHIACNCHSQPFLSLPMWTENATTCLSTSSHYKPPLFPLVWLFSCFVYLTPSPFSLL